MDYMISNVLLLPKNQKDSSSSSDHSTPLWAEADTYVTSSQSPDDDVTTVTLDAVAEHIGDQLKASNSGAQQQQQQRQQLKDKLKIRRERRDKSSAKITPVSVVDCILFWPFISNEQNALFASDFNGPEGT